MGLQSQIQLCDSFSMCFLPLVSSIPLLNLNAFVTLIIPVNVCCVVISTCERLCLHRIVRTLSYFCKIYSSNRSLDGRRRSGHHRHSHARDCIKQAGTSSRQILPQCISRICVPHSNIIPSIARNSRNRIDVRPVLQPTADIVSTES